ncbi:MAG: MraY family glycosyltransferase, partial [Rhodanobacter sp.]
MSDVELSVPWLAVLWLLLSFVIALWVVRGAIAYARQHNMLDLPGQRRSHEVPTPRGGGIGIVVSVAICWPGALLSLHTPLSAGMLASAIFALLLVAAAGWMDDHRSLPVWPRLSAQGIAVGVFSLMLTTMGMPFWWLPLLLGAGVWSINLHNFMDGIDGFLAQQMMFVAVGMAGLAWSIEQSWLVVAAGVLAGACLGFWCFNRSPARIFMGDVGSGSAGLLIFVLGVLLWREQAALVWPVLILCSAFALDATLTLLIRVWRGRRWYHAHREHLYQWLVRRGYS